MTLKIRNTLAILTLFISLGAGAAPGDLQSSNPGTQLKAPDYYAQQSEIRAEMEKMQEQAFQQYIESLKNYPPARQLPVDVQQRRAQMIDQMQEQHDYMMKIRKQRQQEFEKHRKEQINKMHRT